MKYSRILIIILILMYITQGCPEWLADGESLRRIFVYPFYHANIFHLACNCLALHVMFAHKDSAGLELIIGYAISCLVFPLATRPVVGISNLIFGIIGMRSPAFSNRAYWKNPIIIEFYAVNVLALLIPGISAVTHLAALFLGICTSYICRALAYETQH